MDKGFNILQRMLQSTNVRQKVLASNIANADTPGYKAKDVKFNNLLKDEMKIMQTDPGHMSNTGNSSISGSTVIESSPSWGDRNNVEINKEVAKMTENALMHDAALKILNSKIKMYRRVFTGR